jgi:hypothetical protein
LDFCIVDKNTAFAGQNIPKALSLQDLSPNSPNPGYPIESLTYSETFFFLGKA